MSTLGWLALTIGLLFSMAIVAEYVVRWEFRRRGTYYVWPPGRRAIIRPDREACPAAEEVVHFEINSEGERGDEPPKPEECSYRILIAGGSAAECSLLDQRTSWPGALQRILGRPENLAALGVNRVHVGNVAKSMIDSHAMARVFQAILPRYPRLDAIIVFVGASNVMQWLETGAPVGGVPSTLPDSECFAWRPDGPFMWRPRHTALAELARRLRLRLFRPTDEWNRAGKFMTRVRAMRRKAQPLCDTVPDPSAMLEGYERSLRAALLIAMAHSRRVIVARQPWFDKPQYTPEEESQFWHGGFGNVFNEDVTRFCSSEVICRLMARIDARATNVAEELGLEHIDLRPALESNLSNYYDQIHFTPAGAAKLAEAIAAHLVRSSLAERRDTATAYAN